MGRRFDLDSRRRVDLRGHRAVGIPFVPDADGAQSVVHLPEIALGQVGEFSFIVATLGHQLGVMPDPARNAIVGAANGALEALTRALALESGQAQVMGEIPPQDVDRLTGSGKFTLIAVPIPGHVVIARDVAAVPPARFDALGPLEELEATFVAGLRHVEQPQRTVALCSLSHASGRGPG